MKIAVIYSGLLGAAWSVSDGLTRTLKKMGHEVEEWPLGRQTCRPLHYEFLKNAEFILVSGLEHFVGPSNLIFSQIREVDWKSLPAPKAAWFHESFFRDDRSFDFTKLRPYADFFFFPAFQDAVMFDQEHFGAKGRCWWLPFGVDTEIFKPLPVIERDIPVGFIGGFYPKRIAYLNALSHHLKVPFVAGGGISVQDIDGLHPLDTAIRLAMNYNRIQVFLNLPAYSRLLVTKVYEAMACGCFVVTPALTGNAEPNMDPLVHCKHLCYYKESNIPFVNQILREYLEREPERRLIAAVGQAEVTEEHSLEKRLMKMLGLCGFPQVPPAERVKLVV